MLSCVHEHTRINPDWKYPGIFFSVWNSSMSERFLLFLLFFDFVQLRIDGKNLFFCKHIAGHH